MPSLVAIILSACTIVTVGLAAPTTYDQRQDGDLNVSSNIENIWIIFGRSSKPSKSSFPLPSTSALAGYAAFLHGAPDPPEESSEVDEFDDDDKNNADSTEPPKDVTVIPSQDNDDRGVFESVGTNDKVEVAIETQPEKHSESVNKTEEEPSRKLVKTQDETPSGKGAKSGKSLWSKFEEIVDNRKGTSLKRELSWGQDVDPVAPARNDYDRNEQNGSNDHNEVGLLTNNHFILLGSGIEDCGPDRQRNSYGICQPALSTE